MENETNKVYKKIETSRQQTQQRAASASSFTMTRSNDIYFRQKLENIKSQTSAIRNDTNNYYEK